MNGHDFEELQGIRLQPKSKLVQHGAQLTPEGEIDKKKPWSAIHSWVDLWPISGGDK